MRKKNKNEWRKIARDMKLNPRLRTYLAGRGSKPPYWLLATDSHAWLIPRMYFLKQTKRETKNVTLNEAGSENDKREKNEIYVDAFLLTLFRRMTSPIIDQFVIPCSGLRNKIINETQSLTRATELSRALENSLDFYYASPKSEIWQVSCKTDKHYRQDWRIGAHSLLRRVFRNENPIPSVIVVIFQLRQTDINKWKTTYVYK